MQELSFIEVTSKDVDQLRRMAIDTFYTAYLHNNDAVQMKQYVDASFCKHQLLKEIENVHSDFFFAIKDDTAVGYMKVNYAEAQIVMHDINAIELERIYVRHEHQAQGIGHVLLEKTIDIAKNREAPYVWLGVWEKNTKAIHFYKRHGFVKFGRHPFVLGEEKQIDILMKYELQYQQSAIRGEERGKLGILPVRRETEAGRIDKHQL
jgi:ribosomal protein S18 acetylase RimI-like enzyme